VLSGRLKS